MAKKHNTNKRVKELFSEIKDIADQPLVDTNRMEIPALQPQADVNEYQREIEQLNKRVRELEALLNGAGKQKENPAPRTAESSNGAGKDAAASAPILYEKEQVGYVFKDNNLTPIQSVSSTLTDLENKLIAPLVDSGRVIGNMQIQPSAERSLTAEDESLANAIAQQASLQIQNLRLLSSAERARQEALEATRQFTHQSWESFLDGIRNSERIGYAYDQKAVEPFVESTLTQHDYEESVQVLDEQVGKLFIQADPDRPLTEEDRAMINSACWQMPRAPVQTQKPPPAA